MASPEPESPVPAAPTPLQEASPTPSPVNVDRFPEAEAYTWLQVVSGLSRPVSMAHAGDGSGRIFILEQAGRVRIIEDGELIQAPFLDITDRVGSQASEQGLLGLDFHPRYTENGYFFVNYTDSSGDTSISRFQVTADPNQADSASETRLLHVPQPFGNHNGGKVAFGPDGYLYLSLGDGGSAGDPQNNGQSLDTFLGKILRLDVDGEEPYGIPPDNPFVSGGGLPEIWAYGLRNPWRFSFDRLTGDLYIADVGQNSFEEINFQPAASSGGENYGWNIVEGFECFRAGDCDTTGLAAPVVVYPTRSEGSCSVTGGFVYRGENLPEWQGIYLYGDYCSGRVWGLLQGENGEWQDERLFETGASITSFGEDEAGELYLVSHGGQLYRLEEQ